MSYTMARLFEAREASEVTADTLSSTEFMSSVVKIAAYRKQQATSEEEAKKAMIRLLQDNEESIYTVDKGFMSSVADLLSFVGRRIITYVVRPIFTFAARIAMAVAEFVMQTVVRLLIVPVLEAIVALAVANPITAAIIAVAGLVGGGYWLWKKFFDTKLPEPMIPNMAGAGPELKQVATAQQAKTPTKLTYISPEHKKGKVPKFEGFGEDVDTYIKEASAMFGLPEDILRGFIKMEAGWTGAMSPTGAIGTGQFVQGTWDSMAGTSEGKAIGMTVIGNRFRTASDPRYNKRVNTLATALLARNNAMLLARNGLPLTGENLYMLHNIGPGIIQVMLGYPASAATLRAMQQNGMLRGQTAEDFLAYQQGRFLEQYQIANTKTQTAAAETPRLSEGVTVDVPNSRSKQGNKTKPSTIPVTPSKPPDRAIVSGPGSTLIEVY